MEAFLTGIGGLVGAGGTAWLAYILKQSQDKKIALKEDIAMIAGAAAGSMVGTGVIIGSYHGAQFLLTYADIKTYLCLAICVYGAYLYLLQERAATWNVWRPATVHKEKQS